ncbi:hypothetical protein B296_00056321, partial [Ensete ventricosum]
LVRPRKASVVTLSGAGFDAGEGNPGSVIILKKRLGVGMAAATSFASRGWWGVPTLPVLGRLYEHWRPPYIRPVTCVGSTTLAGQLPEVCEKKPHGAATVLGLRHFDDRVGDGIGHPRLDSESGEEVLRVEPGVAIALGSRPLESPGTLYFSTRFYPSFSLFLVSLPNPVSSRSFALMLWILIQIETQDREVSESLDSECHDNLELSNVTEMRLVPSDPGQCILAS